MVSDPEWFFYIIKNNGFTYAGVSPTPTKRLRQHNSEIAGGAKYTTSKGPGWEHICLISGFRDKIEAMQFEWAVKHAPPRNAGGIQNRIKKLHTTCWKERWTTNAPLAEEVPLNIHWKCDPTMFVSANDNTYPEYVSQFQDAPSDTL